MAVLSLFALSGCGAHTSGARPAWVDKGANPDHPDFLYVVGRCTGRRTADDARACALADAREQLRAVTGAPGGLVQGEYSESRMGMVDQGGGTHVLAQLNDYWILLAFPRRQLAAPAQPAAGPR
jgi:hypothetical protein